MVIVSLDTSAAFKRIAAEAESAQLWGRFDRLGDEGHQFVSSWLLRVDRCAERAGHADR
ncbi:hypothetical protein [Garicola koreensis]|uniref:Uncharacterized protein n=1 Tax=Garicola koreensis TaxID=1262554 RepID=A0A7W5Y081_9MICC|nr:hypothetical protein [Garicola koreensis]MBB3668181.1 hypothetical protein [Garicola koreensis]